MNKGFFRSAELAGKAPRSLASHCGLCGLYKHCQSPKMPATGEGRKKILVLAEAPGAEEDRRNIQLIGKAGKRLRRSLRKLKISLDRDCWKTNSIICRREENKTPEDYMIEACRPNLIKTIKKYNPNLILLLGGVALKSLLPVVWDKDVGAAGRWGGYCIPCQELNVWIVATYHPSFLLRKHDVVLDKIFQRHLRLMLGKYKNKPWQQHPNYEDHIEIIMRPSRAAKFIKNMIKKGGVVAFDYEANCLKPEWEKSEIITCSVCWNGKKTIAYPFTAEAIEATDLLLKSSSTQKIASNLKFEDRWSRAKFGHPVRNWYWDTMLAAHVLNNTPDTTSIKFQGFVRLGMKPWDTHIEPYLKSGKSSPYNRIKELDMKDLLLYNGLDSFIEYKVAMEQIKQFRYIRNLEKH